jgi:AraC-like DNA-binding protein
MLTAHQTLDGLSLFVAPPALHQHDRHAHDCLSVIMLTAGQKSYSIERHRVPVAAGQIAIANPGEVHGCEYVADTPWAHRTWYVSHALLSHVSQEAGLTRCAEIDRPVIDSPLTHSQLVAAHAAAQRGNELEREGAALSGLMLLLAGFGSEHAKPQDDSGNRDARARVQRCRQLIDERWALRLNLTMLADEAGVGRHQLIRDFQNVLRLTPGEYLRSVRLQHTKVLMAQGMPLAHVAMAAGFSNQSHFSRTFKRVHGFTPSEYATASQRRRWMQML